MELKSEYYDSISRSQKHINERDHIENLFNNRFNFFLTLFAAYIAAIATIPSYINLLLAISILTTVILFFLMLSLQRAHARVRVHNEIIKQDERSALSETTNKIDNLQIEKSKVDQEKGSRRYELFRGSKNNYVGTYNLSYSCY